MLTGSNSSRTDCAIVESRQCIAMRMWELGTVNVGLAFIAFIAFGADETLPVTQTVGRYNVVGSVLVS
jgi:hypothetical protein